MCSFGMMSIYIKSWERRLGSALRVLEAAQHPFLEGHWKVVGYPPSITFNGRDETPYPRDDVLQLYDAVLRPRTKDEEANLNPLRQALDPVRAVLRSHPALGKALGPAFGNDKFMIKLVSGTSLTWLSLVIVGLMERAGEFSENGFELAASELGALLDASMASTKVDVPSELDLGYDVLFFFGPELERRIEIKSDLIAMPFLEVRDWVDADSIRDFVPEHVEWRDLRQIGVVVRPFRWKPELLRLNEVSAAKRRTRPQFEDEALSFLELLAISNQTEIIPFVRHQNCAHRVASQLLGQPRASGEAYQLGVVGRRCIPNRNPPRLYCNSIQQSLSAFAVRGEPNFARLSLVRRRLAEALARDGRFRLDDRILDVSQSIELMCEIKGTGIGKKIQSSMASLLAADEDHGSAIRKAIKQFYDVRSAIVHGPSDSYRMRLMKDREQVFRSGFNLAQQAFFKLLLEK